MSLLERKGKGKIDDTVPLKCNITGFLNTDGHTVRKYIILHTLLLRKR